MAVDAFEDSPASGHSRRSSTDSSLLHEIEEWVTPPRPTSRARGSRSGGQGQGQDSGASRQKARALIFLGLSSVGSYVCLGAIASGNRRWVIPYLPPITFLLLTLATRLVHVISVWKDLRLDQASGTNQNCREALWRNALRGLLSALALYLQVEAIDHVGVGLLQALEVIVPTILVHLLRPFSIEHRPSANLMLAAQLCSCTVLLAVSSQQASTFGAALSISSALAQALYLALSKNALATSPSSPTTVLSDSAPFSFVFGAALAFLTPSQSPVNGHYSRYLEVFGGDSGLIVSIAFFLFRNLELLSEMTALHILHVPISVALLHPVRNAVTLICCSLLGVFTGVQTTFQILAVHVVNCFILACLEPEVQTTLVALFGKDTALPIEIPSSPGYKSDSGAWSPPAIASNSASTILRVSSVFNPTMLVLWLLSTQSYDVGRRGFAVPSRQASTFDMVFSYYDEPIDTFMETIQNVRTIPSIAPMHQRVIIYVKHDEIDLAQFMQTTGADEVIRLTNVGREGETYLTHIMRHYNATTTNLETPDNVIEVLSSRPDFGLERVSKVNVIGLSDYTLFMQPHLAWHWIGQPRLEMFDPSKTGFISLGPYLTSDCGEDGLGNGNYERVKDIYEMFEETFCPPTLQLATYAGQFIVSRERIMANTYLKYDHLRKLIGAPSNHWLHNEGTWFGWKGSTDETKEKLILHKLRF